MKLHKIILIAVVLIFTSIILNAQIYEPEWNTFMGSGYDDFSMAFTQDSSGNIYVTGYSYSSWGAPVNAHSGNMDVFVACLDSSGNLIWNTFLGSSQDESGLDIARDSSGNLVLTGYCKASWGAPVNAHSGNMDVFVACLDSSGNLLWNTFLGSNQSDFGYGITTDDSGTIYLTGVSWSSWGNPENAFSGSADSFVASLDGFGNLLWNTFFGSDNRDECFDIGLDISGHIYVIGYSWSTWGSPVNAHSGDWDAYIVSLDISGGILWNTFLGSGNSDYGQALTFDDSGNIYATGYSNSGWGSPLNSHSGSSDAFVACLNSSGNLTWNTFLGSSQDDAGYDIIRDSSGNLYLTGFSTASWGSPLNGYNGYGDVFVACTDSSGNMIWNTFLGSSGEDYVYGIGQSSSGSIYVTGFSMGSWGTPVNEHSGGCDAFFASLSVHPQTEIIANGIDFQMRINQTDTLQIRVSLNSNGLTKDADFWLCFKSDSGYNSYYNEASNSWEQGTEVSHQGALFDLTNKKVFQSSKLPPGEYTFFFGVDMKMDGKLTKDCLYYDEVKVTITED
jgi:hypothetical protein